jgi:hypothetical protein
MRNVQRLKELWSLGELGATPDVPSTHVAFGGMPKTVQRLEMERIQSDSDFLVWIRLNRGHANALAKPSLCVSRRFHLDSI